MRSNKIGRLKVFPLLQRYELPLLEHTFHFILPIFYIITLQFLIIISIIIIIDIIVIVTVISVLINIFIFIAINISTLLRLLIFNF